MSLVIVDQPLDEGVEFSRPYSTIGLLYLSSLTQRFTLRQSKTCQRELYDLIQICKPTACKPYAVAAYRIHVQCLRRIDFSRSAGEAGSKELESKSRVSDWCE